MRTRGRPRLPDNELSVDAIRMRKVYALRKKLFGKTGTPVSQMYRNHAQSTLLKSIRMGGKAYSPAIETVHKFGVFAFSPSCGTMNGKPIWRIS